MWGNDADCALNKNAGLGANAKSGTGLSQDCPFILSVRTVFSLERSFLCLSFSCPDSTILAVLSYTIQWHTLHSGPLLRPNRRRIWKRSSLQRSKTSPTTRTNCGRQARREPTSEMIASLKISFRTDLPLGAGAHALRGSAGGSASSAACARCDAASRSRRSSVTSALAVSRIASA